MSETFDVIVIGLGGFGSSSLYELAKRGERVLGIEQFGIAHARGSSHGETRIIRRAYFEHPDYVPLLDHSYGLWRELEQESGNDLMNLCGLVLSGPADGESVPGVLLAKQQHDIAIDEVTHNDARRLFPQIRFPDSHTILAENEAGYLRVEDCVRTHCEQAQRHGAVVRTNETVTAWKSNVNSVTVQTNNGSYECDKLVIAGGAWSSSLLRELGMELQILRKPVFWFPKSKAKSKSNANAVDWPVFYFEEAGRSFYGLPGLDAAMVKVAEHSGGTEVADPANVNREMSSADRDSITAFVESSLVGLESSPCLHNVCMYAMSNDGHFVVDFHPQHERVIVAAGFSGHGFKFTPVIGQAIADLALTDDTVLPIDLFAMR